MSGTEIGREHIVAGRLSATADSKPADVALELHRELHTWRPEAEGLYDPSLEKDSCGVGFIANIKGQKSHQIVADALSILCNLEDRKSTRLNSSHRCISYAVFCLKKKKKKNINTQ